MEKRRGKIRVRAEYGVYLQDVVSAKVFCDLVDGLPDMIDDLLSDEIILIEEEFENKFLSEIHLTRVYEVNCSYDFYKGSSYGPMSECEPDTIDNFETDDYEITYKDFSEAFFGLLISVEEKYNTIVESVTLFDVEMHTEELDDVF